MRNHLSACALVVALTLTNSTCWGYGLAELFGCGGNSCNSGCGCDVGCGCETSCCCEASCGCETSCCCEPSCGCGSCCNGKQFAGQTWNCCCDNGPKWCPCTDECGCCCNGVCCPTSSCGGCCEPACGCTSCCEPACGCGACCEPSCGCGGCCDCRPRRCYTKDFGFGAPCYYLAKALTSCCGCSGCDSELYWSEWHNDPPYCCDPCDCYGNWTGPSGGGYYRAPYAHAYSPGGAGAVYVKNNNAPSHTGTYAKNNAAGRHTVARAKQPTTTQSRPQVARQQHSQVARQQSTTAGRPQHMQVARQRNVQGHGTFQR